MQPHHTTSRACARVRREAALGLVEVIIVLLIIAIIGAIAVMSTGSAKANGTAHVARATARTLAEAIEQFSRDHGGRLPGAPGTDDWTPQGATGAAAWQSPVDIANGRQPYVKGQAVQPLVEGQVALLAASGAAGGGAAQPAATIRYVPDATRGTFALDVQVRRGQQLVPLCHVSSAEGGARPAGVNAEQRC